MAKRLVAPALLVRVLTEIGAGRIYEGWLGDKDCYIHGQTDGVSIRINPAIGVVDTVIHEALHRLEPSWSENYVRRTTSWLLKRMSDPQIEQLYEEYQRLAKRRKKRSRVLKRGIQLGTEAPVRPDPSGSLAPGSGANGGGSGDARGEQLPAGEERSSLREGSD